MKCADCRNKILLDNAGELSHRQAEALRDHLAACPDCRDYGQQLEKLTAAAVEGLPVGEPTRATLARIRAAAEASPPARVVLFPRPVLPSLAYAAALLLVLGAWFTFAPNGKTDPAVSLSSLVAMVTGEEVAQAEPEASATDDEQLRALARQILIMEGLAPEELGEWDSATLDVELPPTTLRSHSSDGFPA